jgi:hypothetical protein
MSREKLLLSQKNFGAAPRRFRCCPNLARTAGFQPALDPDESGALHFPAGYCPNMGRSAGFQPALRPRRVGGLHFPAGYCPNVGRSAGFQPASESHESLCDNPSLRVIPRSPPFLVADDDPSPEGFGPQGEESRTALKTLRARFLSRDCGIGMTAWAGLSHRLHEAGAAFPRWLLS